MKSINSLFHKKIAPEKALVVNPVILTYEDRKIFMGGKVVDTEGFDPKQALWNDIINKIGGRPILHLGYSLLLHVDDDLYDDDITLDSEDNAILSTNKKMICFSIKVKDGNNRPFRRPFITEKLENIERIEFIRTGETYDYSFYTLNFVVKDPEEWEAAEYHFHCDLTMEDK